ncbi:DedA family protein [Baekduia soli]|uniref:DedA family protein n=1 Tax=Baekduia soli TaxID=496014 RepID=A0A5B8UB05_9ACTN|nr:DedA family protein [Baekduia soli]QEC50336.1 DedA family protein [Baekduia soli]
MSLANDVGYPALFGLVMAESGGVPVPGETALIAAGVLAGQGQLDLALVIVVAASAAIIGDNLGYLIGRRGGRRLLERPGRFATQRQRVLEVGEPFFERHGPKAVFFGRWILGLRVWASWLAGITRMRWRSFLAFNALGGISWAATVGVLAYVAGDAVGAIIRDVGVGALVVVAIVLAVGLFLRHRRHAGP